MQGEGKPNSRYLLSVVGEKAKESAVALELVLQTSPVLGMRMAWQFPRT